MLPHLCLMGSRGGWEGGTGAGGSGWAFLTLEAACLLVGHVHFLTVDVSCPKDTLGVRGVLPTSWDPEDDPATPVALFFPQVFSVLSSCCASAPASQTCCPLAFSTPSSSAPVAVSFLCDFCKSCHKTLKFCPEKQPPRGKLGFTRGGLMKSLMEIWATVKYSK